MVSDVLTKGERTVRMNTRSHFNLIECLFHHFRAGIESSFVLSRPPVDHVTVLVELTALIVKAVGHLVSDDYTDSTVVEGIVSAHVEERILENTGREADLVGRGVVVRVHGLRIHVPFLLIHRLAEVTQAVLLLELSGTLDVRIVRIFGVDIQLGVVTPLVRITDLDRDRIQFLQGFGFGLIAHPREVLDANTKGFLEVLDER